MLHHPRRHLRLSGVHNIRDLGGYRTAAGAEVPWRRFLRADSPHRLAPAQTQRLVADEGLRTVIDLRTRTELTEAPNPFASHPDVSFVNVPLFDDLAPAILDSKPVDDGHPLLQFYLAALSQRQAAIREVVSAMAAAPAGAVMFNCTAGKDRTGIVAAMLLGLAGVDRADILADYALTADLIPGLVRELMAKAEAHGRDLASYARLLESPAPTMQAALGHIDAQHGSIPAYLAAIGVPRADLSALQTRLTTA